MTDHDQNMNKILLSPNGNIEVNFQVGEYEITEEIYPLCGMANQLTCGNITVRADTFKQRVTKNEH